jgi:acetyl-CoA carboxylase biotin carboxyl carrier protein
MPEERTDDRAARARSGERSKGESSTDDATAERSAGERQADHAAIDRLAGDLLPALVAKLADSGLGEIEIREGSWRVRVRRPGGDGTGHPRRTGDRASRAQPGHAGHGHPPAGFEGHRSSKDSRATGEARETSGTRETRAGAGNQTNGSTPLGLIPVGPGAEPSGTGTSDEGDGMRTVATSPAVGVYQPRPDAKSGSRVRAGDRLGAVDMLGIPQEVVAPVDGIVGASLVEPGQAVEYGQELVVIEPPDDDDPTGGSAPAKRPSRDG